MRIRSRPFGGRSGRHSRGGGRRSGKSGQNSLGNAFPQGRARRGGKGVPTVGGKRAHFSCALLRRAPGGGSSVRRAPGRGRCPSGAAGARTMLLNQQHSRPFNCTQARRLRPAPRAPGGTPGAAGRGPGPWTRRRAGRSPAGEPSASTGRTDLRDGTAIAPAEALHSSPSTTTHSPPPMTKNASPSPPPRACRGPVAAAPCDAVVLALDDREERGTAVPARTGESTHAAG